MVQDPARYRNPWSSLIASQPEQKDLLAEPQFFFSGDEHAGFPAGPAGQGEGLVHRRAEKRADHAFVPRGAQAGNFPAWRSA